MLEFDAAILEVNSLCLQDTFALQYHHALSEESLAMWVGKTLQGSLAAIVGSENNRGRLARLALQATLLLY